MCGYVLSVGLSFNDLIVGRHSIVLGFVPAMLTDVNVNIPALRRTAMFALCVMENVKRNIVG
jgi:hypothetical protein